MLYLLVVSLIWAFSFGLIKGRLSGVDPAAVAVLRLALSLIVFLPFLRLRSVPSRMALRLCLIGAVQFGIMYVVYLRAFAHLQAYEIALFTITTPLFVTLLDGVAQRSFVVTHAAAAVLSVLGAGVILWQRIGSQDAMAGVLLVQASNLCFAAGQLAWRKARNQIPADVSDASVFALPYAGAVLSAAAWSLFTTDWTTLRLTMSQGITIAYLGVLASGVCFFWWNVGATRVNTGTLAAFNNAKIPLAVACSLLFFGETADLPRLLIGGGLMAIGVVVAEWKPRRRTAT